MEKPRSKPPQQENGKTKPKEKQKQKKKEEQKILIVYC